MCTESLRLVKPSSSKRHLSDPSVYGSLTGRDHRRRGELTMASPFYFILEGTFQIIGKEPDGDSVRFAALNPDDWGKLHRSFRIKPSPTDGTVQLRFEGIDAPETHYGSDAQ